MRKSLWLPAVLLLSLPATLFAEIKTKVIEYKDGTTTCKGFLAYDSDVAGARPGVLVVPEWWGLTDYPKMRATELAKLGYVAFVADMYGDGKTTDDPKEAGSIAMPMKQNIPQFRARVTAGLEALKAEGTSAGVLDVKQLGAIGYCFGGSAVLELARASTPDLKGVVSFHGGLSTPTPAKSGDVKCRVLACCGDEDPMVSGNERMDFVKEMKESGAVYEIDVYSGAEHAFTNPDADRHKIPGISYNATADKRSWESMKAFFADVFKTTPSMQK